MTVSEVFLAQAGLVGSCERFAFAGQVEWGIRRLFTGSIAGLHLNENDTLTY